MFIFGAGFFLLFVKVFFQVFVFFRIFFRKFFCIPGVTEFVCVIGSFTVGSFAVDSCLIICVLGVGNFLRSSRFSVCSFLRSRYISNGIKHNVVSGSRCASFRFLSLRWFFCRYCFFYIFGHDFTSVFILILYVVFYFIFIILSCQLWR